MPAVSREAAKPFGRDRVGVDLAARDLGGQLARGAHDLVAGAVVEGDDERQRVLPARQRLGFLEQRRDVGRQPFAVADHAHPHAVLVQFGEVAADEELQQTHRSLTSAFGRDQFSDEKA